MLQRRFLFCLYKGAGVLMKRLNTYYEENINILFSITLVTLLASSKHCSATTFSIFTFKKLHNSWIAGYLTHILTFMCCSVGELLDYTMKWACTLQRFSPHHFYLLQTDDEWEEDELGRGEQGVSISQLLSEKRYKG
jgi:hypothetical protein